MVSLQDNLDACDFLQLLTSAYPHYLGLIRIKQVSVCKALSALDVVVVTVLKCTVTV